MDLIENCQRALDGAKAMVATVQPQDLATQTPCSEWDVKGLINHMIGVCQGFAGALSGATTGPGGPGGEADLVGDDPGAAYAQAADTVMREWRAPGALEKTVKMPMGEMPGTFAVQIVTADQLIHTWDLAKALGRPYAMDPDLATATYEMARQNLGPEMRGPGTAFAAEVPCPETAPIHDRLVAFLGRQP